MVFFEFSKGNKNTKNVYVINVNSGHAWQRHGGDAEKALRTLDKYGSSYTYQTDRPIFGKRGLLIADRPATVFIARNEEDDKWYSVVTTHFEKIHSSLRESTLITAYAMSSQFESLEDYKNHILENWGAKEVNFHIPPDSIRRSAT